jgi:hypothetical protein
MTSVWNFFRPLQRGLLAILWSSPSDKSLGYFRVSLRDNIAPAL